MKRTVPLLITGISGLILVVSVFVPVMVRLGEDTAVWFDLLAGIAFILGGGNLLKVHLKKVSDRAAGWGYSGVTIVAFLLTLYFGLFKVGVSPEPTTEYYGELFVHFPLDRMPIYSVEGRIPERPDEERIPASVLRSIAQDGDRVTFRGWMTQGQKDDLMAYDTSLEWQCMVERLFNEAQPSVARSRIKYHSDHETLGFVGYMSDDDYENLLSMLSEVTGSREALTALRDASRVPTQIRIPDPPQGVVNKLQPSDDDDGGNGGDESEEPLPGDLVLSSYLQPEGEELSEEELEDLLFQHFDRVHAPRPDEKPQSSDYLKLGDNTLTVTGPVTIGLRDQLAEEWPAWPRVRPIPGENLEEFTQAREQRTEAFIAELEALGGELNAEQRKAVLKQFTTIQDALQVIDVINAAGVGQDETREPCDLWVERTRTETQREEAAEATGEESPDEPIVLDAEIEAGEDVLLNERQAALIQDYAANPEMTLEQLKTLLNEGEPEETSFFADEAERALNSQPTLAAFKRQVAFELLKTGPLTQEQQNWLFADYRIEYAWRQAMDELLLKAHVTKYAWSGSHEQEGSLFWWCYAFLFRPLVATMFAMLAFYVASAAFRAFRAKNIEALLLLGTAFIILLGHTSVGVSMTAWIPERFSAFKIDELSLYVSQIFMTAGNRAIMIGIALGVASTSLKVLLGVDRSYLGTGDD